MRHNRLRRSRERAGFTMAETLIAVLILLLVSLIVASGVPLAVKAYHNILSVANAETLLSTAVIRLRDELGEATDITVGLDHETITFTDANGIRTTLYPGGEGEGVVLQYHIDEAPVYTIALVSEGSSDQNLYLDYGGTSANAVSYSNGMIVIRNLSVKSGTRVLASLSELKIRVLADVITQAVI